MNNEKRVEQFKMFGREGGKDILTMSHYLFLQAFY